MMNVDRCDVIQLTAASELRISHEWRASADVPSSLGTAIPLNLGQLSEHVDLSKPIRLDDTSAPGLDQKVRFIAKSLRTRSLLVVPVILGEDVLDSLAELLQLGGIDLAIDLDVDQRLGLPLRA